MMTVFWKEWRDVLRDRKALVALVLLPLMLTPIIIAAAAGFGYLAAEKSAAERYTYAWQGDAISDFDNALVDSEYFSAAGEAIADVNLSGSGTVIEATFDTGDIQSALASRLDDIVRELNREQAKATLAPFDLVPADLSPWQLSEVDESGDSAAQSISGTMVGLILPILLLVSVLTTSISLSGDLVAGERERNTLETLLASPASASSVLLAKWLMLASAGILSAVLMIGSMSIFLVPAKLLLPDGVAELLAAWSPVLLIHTLVMAIPIAVLVAGALLTVTRSAKTFKEAQSQASFVFLLIYLPIMFAAQGLLDPTPIVLLIPILNYPVAIQTLAAGDLTWWMPVLTITSNLVVAVGLGLIYASKVNADDLLNDA